MKYLLLLLEVGLIGPICLSALVVEFDLFTRYFVEGTIFYVALQSHILHIHEMELQSQEALSPSFSAAKF